MYQFQLTRSVGSVTHQTYCNIGILCRFQLTRSVGSVTSPRQRFIRETDISTHTLRGERDAVGFYDVLYNVIFQLTRSVGSVTVVFIVEVIYFFISTHTLRGERDEEISAKMPKLEDFNSHAPWGA